MCSRISRIRCSTRSNGSLTGVSFDRFFLVHDGATLARVGRHSQRPKSYVTSECLTRQSMAQIPSDCVVNLRTLLGQRVVPTMTCSRAVVLPKQAALREHV